MEFQDRLRATLLSTIIRDTPKKFWEDARALARQIYMDAFHEVANSPTVVSVQRLDKLYQERYFRMEHWLQTIAQQNGLVSSPTMLKANNCYYMYVTSGAIGITQSYVPAIGEMPKFAKFRERYAALMRLSIERRLDLGDEPREMSLPKDFYGLFSHNPVGKRFNEDDQKLGLLQFCLPNQKCSAWAAELTMPEILAAYESIAPSKKADRKLPWKKTARKEEKA